MLAPIIWLLVNHSMTDTVTIDNIPVKLINVPKHKTVEGMNRAGYLDKKISLNLFGTSALLEDLTPNDLEVVIDVSNIENQWHENLTKKNLICHNQKFDINQGINRISHQNFLINFTKLVKDKIPLIVTQPIGEAPKGYQYLDIYPYSLYLSVQGPEDIIKHLKTKGVKLTFNLNDIPKDTLDSINCDSSPLRENVVNYFVPRMWKEILVPLLSDKAITIDDPKAKELRIDFIRSDLLPIENPIPITLFFTLDEAITCNNSNYSIKQTALTEKVHSFDVLKTPLFASGVSPLFLDVVGDMLQMQILISPQSERSNLDWSLQFVNPRILENRYISLLMSEHMENDQPNLSTNLREDYLRNRFRNYMQRIMLHKANGSKLKLNIELEGNEVIIKSPTL